LDVGIVFGDVEEGVGTTLVRHRPSRARESKKESARERERERARERERERERKKE